MILMIHNSPVVCSAIFLLNDMYAWRQGKCYGDDDDYGNDNACSCSGDVLKI